MTARRRWWLLLLAALGVAAALLLLLRPGGGSGHAVTGRAIAVTDDMGRQLSVRLPVRRVVVVNRYNVEFVRALAGMGRVVGLDARTAADRAYWPGVTDAMVVGQGQSELDYERIVALKPDVLLIPRNGEWAEASRVLQPFGIPVVVVTGWDVLKHGANMRLLGDILGEPARAAELDAFYRRWHDLLRARLAGAPRPPVYFEEVGDFRTVLPGSGWHDMIELAGGRNVFGDIVLEAGRREGRGGVQGFTVDPEAVLARRPALIVKLQPGQYAPHPPAFSRRVLESVAARPGFGTLPAIREGRVHHMSYHFAGGCSKVIGALAIAKWLHPERFADVDPDAVMAEWLTRFQGVPALGGYSTSLREVRRMPAGAGTGA